METQTEIEVVTPEKKIAVRSEELCASAGRAIIDSPETLKKGADLARMIRGHLKIAEDERTKITKPMNTALKEVNARFKRYTEPLEDAKASIDQKMVAYNLKIVAERRKLEEEQRKTEEAARALECPDEQPFVPPAVTTASAPVRGNLGSVASFVPTWDFEVVDISKVPPELLEVKSADVRKRIAAGARKDEIPGIRIFEKTQLRVR